MSDEFDPYLKWLGIPPKFQPPTHYRLLGLEAFESDPDAIENAADRQMAHLRTFRTCSRASLMTSVALAVVSKRTPVSDVCIVVSPFASNPASTWPSACSTKSQKQKSAC